MKKKGSDFSCLNIFKGGDSSDDPPQSPKAYKSDHTNRLPVVADRHINAKADDFIDKFHKKNQGIDPNAEDVNQGCEAIIYDPTNKLIN
jgi:hypothetical protein